MSEDVEQLVMQAASSMDEPALTELVDKLVIDNGLRFEDVTKAVYSLWKGGVLELLEPEPPLAFTRYASSLRSLWFWAVTALVAITTIIVLSTTTPPLLYIRYLLGSLFILYLPGSMLVEVLYPRGGDLPLEPLVRLIFSTGLSLAVVPLMGLALNFTPWGIRLTPITMFLGGFTEAMAVVALVRKHRHYKLGLVGKGSGC